MVIYKDSEAKEKREKTSMINAIPAMQPRPIKPRFGSEQSAAKEVIGKIAYKYTPLVLSIGAFGGYLGQRQKSEEFTRELNFLRGQLPCDQFQRSTIPTPALRFGMHRTMHKEAIARKDKILMNPNATQKDKEEAVAYVERIAQMGKTPELINKGAKFATSAAITAASAAAVGAADPSSAHKLLGGAAGFVGEKVFGLGKGSVADLVSDFASVDKLMDDNPNKDRPVEDVPLTPYFDREGNRLIPNEKWVLNEKRIKYLEKKWNDHIMRIEQADNARELEMELNWAKEARTGMWKFVREDGKPR